MDTHIREFNHKPNKNLSSLSSSTDLSIKHSIHHQARGQWQPDPGFQGILIINKTSEILYANAYARHLFSQMRMTINTHGIITDQSGLGYGDLGYITSSKESSDVDHSSDLATDFKDKYIRKNIEKYIEKYIENELELTLKQTSKVISVGSKKKHKRDIGDIGDIGDKRDHGGVMRHPFQSIWQLCEIFFKPKNILHPLSKTESLSLVVEDDVDFPVIGTLRLQCRSFHLDPNERLPLVRDDDRSLLLDKNGSNACVLVTLQQVSIVTAKEAIAQFQQHRLTEREHRIWQLHQRGWGHRDIAAKLRLPIQKVQQRLQTILIKQQTWDLPQPGEIWQVDRNIDHPHNLPYSLPQALFSAPAQEFLGDDRSSRYVIVMGTPHPLTTVSTTQLWVAVMVLSPQLDAMGESDALLPTHLSGLNNDVVAETWHVVPMLVSQFLCPVSKPLPQSIYEQLVPRGDRSPSSNRSEVRDRSDSRQPNSQVLKELGDLNPSLLEQFLFGSSVHSDPFHSGQFTMLNTSNTTTITTQLQRGRYPVDHPHVQAFHHQERQWSEVLRIPVTTCQLYVDTLQNTESIVDDAVWLEQLRRGEHNDFDL